MKPVFEAGTLHTWFYEIRMLMTSYGGTSFLENVFSVMCFCGLVSARNSMFQAEHLAFS